MVSRSVQVSRDLWHMGIYHSISEELVRQFTQAVVSVNLELIRRLICDGRCSVFSIAFDEGTNSEDNNIDLRLRLAVRGKIVNLHGLAIPIHGSHTGEHINLTVSHFLEGLSTLSLCRLETQPSLNRTCIFVLR